MNTKQIINKLARKVAQWTQEPAKATAPQIQPVQPASAPQMAVKPEVEQIYTTGQIVYASWGYDQTNIDWFIITKRTKTMVTLQPIGEKLEDNGNMTGKTVPDPDCLLDEPAIRRKVIIFEGKEWGMNFEPTYGSIKLWDGKPKYCSSYA